jgi:UDP-N-acetylglucosamine--N-acetylmuramyl-(pentapeptide) pyrophosphoryl-undecaprenol N-acetylglucosamine transferase
MSTGETRHSSSGNILIAAGGTGGHLFPAQALAEELLSKGLSPGLVTDARGEQLLRGSSCIACYIVASGRMAGRSPVGLLISVFKMAVGIKEAWSLVRTVCPAAVVGFGGYASVPLLVASKLAGIPVLIHESNAVLGRANRLLSYFANVIATSFAETVGLRSFADARLIHTGTPVRKTIRALENVEYQPPYASSKIHLLVLGGSQGSKAVGKIVPEAVQNLSHNLRERLVVTQQVRVDDKAYVGKLYNEAGVTAFLHPFVGNMSAALEKSHLIIARAGASTIAELAVSGRPSVLIPLPNAVDNHQMYNAKNLADAGGGWLLEESKLTAEYLAQLLARLLENPADLSAAAFNVKLLGKPNATSRLAEEIIKLASLSSQKKWP